MRNLVVMMFLILIFICGERTGIWLYKQDVRNAMEIFDNGKYGVDYLLYTKDNTWGIQIKDKQYNMFSLYTLKFLYSSQIFFNTYADDNLKNKGNP